MASIPFAVAVALSLYLPSTLVSAGTVFEASHEPLRNGQACEGAGCPEEAEDEASVLLQSYPSRPLHPAAPAAWNGQGYCSRKVLIIQREEAHLDDVELAQLSKDSSNEIITPSGENNYIQFTGALLLAGAEDPEFLNLVFDDPVWKFEDEDVNLFKYGLIYINLNFPGGMGDLKMSDAQKLKNYVNHGHALVLGDSGASESNSLLEQLHSCIRFVEKEDISECSTAKAAQILPVQYYDSYDAQQLVKGVYGLQADFDNKLVDISYDNSSHDHGSYHSDYDDTDNHSSSDDGSDQGSSDDGSDQGSSDDGSDRSGHDDTYDHSSYNHGSAHSGYDHGSDHGSDYSDSCSTSVPIFAQKVNSKVTVGRVETERFLVVISDDEAFNDGCYHAANSESNLFGLKTNLRFFRNLFLTRCDRLASKKW